MVRKTFIDELFEFGLGELFVLQTGGAEPVLGQVVQDKGKLVLKDRKMMAGVTPAQFGLCNDLGIVGAVCYERGNEWQSLTFVGPEHCQLTQDLSSTHVGLMTASTNEFNERLIDFHGSVYRGFKLLLDNHFLPVVLKQETLLKDGRPGLAVTNMRVAGVSFEVLGAVHNQLNKLMVPPMSFDVQDMALSESDFDSMFARFKAS